MIVIKLARTTAMRKAVLLLVFGAAVPALGFFWHSRSPKPDKDSPIAIAGTFLPTDPSLSDDLNSAVEPADRTIPTLESVAPATQSAQTSIEAAVVFPDGFSVRVTLQALPSTLIYRRAERLADYYVELSNLARNGEPGAAFLLYHELTSCKKAYRDSRSLEQAVRSFRANGALVLADSSRVAQVPRPANGASSPEELYLMQPYRFCQGLSDEQLAEADVWLEDAIAQGDYRALFLEATLLGSTKAGFAKWEALWRAGYISAISGLILQYRDGTPNGAPDYVRAYAYDYINYLVMQAASRLPSSTIPSVVLQAAADSLSYSGSLLNPQETATAQQLAKELLVDNRNCCFGLW